MADQTTATVPTPATTPAVSAKVEPTVPTPATPVADQKVNSLLGDMPKTEPAKADATKAEPVKPAEIKYELKMPDKSLLPATHTEKIASFAKERGLSNEHAQAVLDMQSEHLKEYVDANVKAYNDRINGWTEELKVHPKFGGDKLPELDRGATEVLNKYGPKGLIEEFQASGYSRNPKVMELLWNIHQAMKPDKIVQPGAPAAKPGERDNSYDAVAERMFPSTKKSK